MQLTSAERRKNNRNEIMWSLREAIRLEEQTSGSEEDVQRSKQSSQFFPGKLSIMKNVVVAVQSLDLEHKVY